MKAVLSEKGQVTIPKDIREKLGLVAGQVIHFETARGLLIGKKSTEDSLRTVVGILRNKVKNVDEEIEQLRGPSLKARHR